MAVGIVSQAVLAVGGADLSEYASGGTLEVGCDVVDFTAMAHAARVRKGGLRYVTFSADGFYSADDGEPEGELFSAVGDDTSPFMYAPADTEGEVAYFAKGVGLNTSMLGAVGDAAGQNVALTGSDGVGGVRGVYLHSRATERTSSGDGTGYQAGTIDAAESLYASLHVVGASGTSPTLDVTVESDDNGGFTSAVTRATFAQASGVSSQWATPLAGPVSDDYWRVSYTIGGTSPSFYFIVAIGWQ